MTPWGLGRLRELAGEDVGQVFDVGGNVGAFAWACKQLWPTALVVSFEPIPELAAENARNAEGRWHTEEAAISDEDGSGVVWLCLNQPTASRVTPGSPLRASLGLDDDLSPVTVRRRKLDDYLRAYPAPDDRGLVVKIDTEGHELQVIEGATETLTIATAVVVECQNHPDVFDGAGSPADVDTALRWHGLHFAGVLDTFTAHEAVWQFDGIWLRPS